MKNLKRGDKVKKREQVKKDRAIFMSMSLPAYIVKGVNRKMRKVS